MTPDEALQYEYFGCAEPALDALKAEVKRLREELATCDPKAVRVEAGIWETDAQRWKARALSAEADAKRLGAIELRLVTENARLRESDQGWTIANKLVAENVERLRAELDRMRAALDFLDDEVKRREEVLSNPPKGMGASQAMLMGDFRSAPPSVISRLRWHIRNIRRDKS